MAEELTMVLERRAERGTRRGATEVLAAARQHAFESVQPPWWRRGPVIVVAAAVVALFVVGGILLATRAATPDTVPPATTIPETPTVPVTTAPTQGDATPAPGADAGAADVVLDLAVAPDGRLWAATDAGVVSWNLETGLPTVLSERDGLPDRFVSDVAVTSEGTVWAAGGTWVARLDGTGWTDLTDGVLSDLPSPVGAIAAAPDGAFWVAAGQDTLIEIDGDVATTHRIPVQWRSSPAEPWTFSMAVDSGSTVWASTMLFGVLAFDGEWRRFGVDNGLPSDVVGNVAVGPDGSVWVGGEGSYGDPGGDIPAAGILRHRNDEWTAFTTADGLLSDEGSVTVGSGGGVWVVHTSLPPTLAERVGLDRPDGVSHFDGTSWQQYPPFGGRGQGMVSADGTLWLPSDGGIIGFDGDESFRLAVGAGDVPPLPPGDEVSLERVEGLDPVRLSTAIGEIEFTTFVLPEDWEGIWWITETAHGVAGMAYPEMTLVGSLDGVTWKEIRTSVQPNEWIAVDDSVVAMGSTGAVRLEWNGLEWAQTNVLGGDWGGGFRARAAGKQGIVAVHGTDVYFSSDGTAFTKANAGPDPSRQPVPRGTCAAPGWVIEGSEARVGPVVAMDAGFVAVAARSEDPICEPLVWISDDGNVWTVTSDESPFGERAFVHDMAAVDDTIVAIGGVSRSEAAVWVSTDGVAWQRADIEAAELWQVTSSDRGWILTGHVSAGGEIGEMWFSVDGVTWDGPYVRPTGWGDRAGLFYSAAMLDDRIIGAGKQFDRPGMAMDNAPPRVVVGVFVDD